MLEPASTLANEWRAWRPRQDIERTTDWGMPWLRNALPAPMPGSLTVVGGRDGTGKSFFAATMASLAAEATERPAVYVSLEDPRLEVGRRAAAAGWSERLLVACPDRQLLSGVEELIAEAGRLGSCWVCIDYLHCCLYDGPVQLWGRESQVATMLSAMKSAAKAARVPLCVLSQLRKPMAGEESTFPTTTMLRDSGMISAMAEYVIMVGGTAAGMRAEVAKAKSAAAGAKQRYERGRGGALIPVEREPNPLDNQGGT